ncbi:shikimate dehydrogenase [Litoreibacter arenae]|uniref:Shikimate dehydrogenase (NADP(+)) n=1 Tax=Litoreibacter arenae DSM 19593 TaxID=1123360 RepID=S9RUN5_9RHOB|nr:shikimate dehydrogenase [Litoreibacter arenae]EPX77624.1 Shikimate 5-dehydrogenase I alpha [Litoreibacter arenae DSM 19593]
MTNDKIPLAGVIGQPITQSKSPVVHAHWLRRYGIRGHYIPMDVSSVDLPHVLNNLPRMGFRGVNITIPHKESVLDIADVISDRAALIGAANTLTFQSDGKLHADNTDGLGFIANLKQEAPGWNPQAGPALVLGAGGASRAVVAALLHERVPEIILTNRTRARADALKAHFGGKIKVVDWTQAASHLDETATLVNTTALGMTGKEELKLNLGRLTSDTLVTDIVYNPLTTPLLAQAEARGCQTVDGLGMLLHQAVPGFERWFGRAPEVDAELRNAVLR